MRAPRWLGRGNGASSRAGRRVHSQACTYYNIRPSKTRDAAACLVAHCRLLKTTRDAIAMPVRSRRRRNTSTVVRLAHAATAARPRSLQRGPKEGHIFNLRVLYDRPRQSTEKRRFTTDPPAVVLEVATVAESERAAQKSVMGGQPITHPGTRKGDLASWGHASNDGA